MSYDDVAPLAHPLGNILCNFLFNIRREIDHHVSQEHYVKLTNVGQIIGRQIELTEVGALAQFFFDQERAISWPLAFVTVFL